MLTLVRDQVERRPGSAAVVDAEREVDYRGLWDLSGSLAHDLVDLGVRPGDLVAVAVDPSVDLVVAFLGVLRAGAAYLPLDNRAPAERLATILDEAAPRVVVRSAAGSRWTGRLPGGMLALTVPRHASTQVGAVPVGREDPAYVAYTSGSTGRPKGVVVPHRAVVRLVTEAAYCPLGPEDRVASLSNPAFDATTFEVWAPLAVGGTVVAVSSPVDLTLDEWVAELRALSISTMFLTTSLFHSIARERPSAFRDLVRLVVGGEQLDADVVRAVLDAGPPRHVVNGYGPTETTTFAAAFECTGESMRDVVRTPIGFPLQNTTLHVLDDHLGAVTPGETGELCVGGPGVALRYLGRPDLTAERFVLAPGSAERVYRTGDLVRQRPDGALEVVGRKDRQVKLRGFRIELEEVEQALSATGLVAAAFVEKIGEGPAAILVGFVLPNAAGAVELPAALHLGLAARLPDYMVPARWIVLSEVPLGATGKADRDQLLALWEASRPIVGETGAGTADDLCRIWKEVLQVPHVDPSDNFLDLGGNSLLAVQVASRLNPGLIGRIEPSDILLAESAAELNARLRYSGAA
ncbi:non-ribosomal peptide synthetase [Umezawaea endophytica]|uniref:Non-ribosomal peptide synthetase n=1 Tax=Umezawaea endophytica TaxID=1654476 RepID=A0A9X2VKE6_9PSEU|nr:non-ribosomal peptide synthetase [Umezawaea endophytica]MCS7476768.1 non-ribosomal peptide synthetase [Umezawaea endophytica]